MRVPGHMEEERLGQVGADGRRKARVVPHVARRVNITGGALSEAGKHRAEGLALGRWERLQVLLALPGPPWTAWAAPLEGPRLSSGFADVFAVHLHHSAKKTARVQFTMLDAAEFRRILLPSSQHTEPTMTTTAHQSARRSTHVYLGTAEVGCRFGTQGVARSAGVRQGRLREAVRAYHLGPEEHPTGAAVVAGYVVVEAAS